MSGQRGAIELLGEGQHVIVDGWHPHSLGGPPLRWKWRGERAPWTVPVSELPIIPAHGLDHLMQRIAISGVLGGALTRTAITTVVKPSKRSNRYEATARLQPLFDKCGSLVKPAIRELVKQIGIEGCGRHDAVVAICGRLVLQRWSDSRAVKFLVPIVNENFGEGDWTKEIENALAHARGRESVRLGAMRGRPWQ